MRKNSIEIISCSFLLFCCEPANAAPSQLYSKSVVVSWTENRVQRPVGTATWASVSRSVSESIYISSAGRPFSRITFSGGRGSGDQDQVGVSGRNPTGGAKVVQFQGRSLVTVLIYNGGARQIRIDFDPNFSSCSASVILGKSSGAGTFTLRSTVSGQMMEIQSQSTSGATCSIREGNVFEN
jgi:hypothetical protein